jgi:hypothetical protein
MNSKLPQELWLQIQQFEFDQNAGEYGFYIRLADENAWSMHFTQLAVEEYKKFMYLAAVSDQMVSPSETVDVVWHQHLIFTQSYGSFCKIIGKQIPHIPSTHSAEEASKFKLAKERTKSLYEQYFGEQPETIWGYSHMLESLQLPKTTYKIRTFLVFGVMAWILIFTPMYLLLVPLYKKIYNPWFTLVFLFATTIGFVFLEVFNRYQLRNILHKSNKQSFIFHLNAAEVLFFKSGKLYQSIHHVVNNLVKRELVVVSQKNELTTTQNLPPNEHLERQTHLSIDEWKFLSYPQLVQKLIEKPAFTNIKNLGEATAKYLHRSKNFGRLFYFNFVVLSGLLMLGSIRLTSGLTFERPVLYISIALIVVLSAVIIYLNRLTKIFLTITIPSFYEEQLLTNNLPKNQTGDWDYFLMGHAALALPMTPIVKHIENTSTANASCSSGGASSCGGGGSCGSSCGGCGGS